MATSTLSLIRELKSEELPQLNDLVSESFGYSKPHTFFDDFPIWKSDRVTRLGIFSGEELISHVGIRFCEMKTDGQEPVRVAMVGAVATEETFRGQGLSSQLLREACRISEEKDCDWTFLWGSEHDFYLKFGFELRGREFQAPLSVLEDIPENTIPKIKKGWDDRIFEALLKSDRGIILTERDRKWFSNHQSVQWFIHETPFAFAGYQRGLDLPHIIHEFGGDPKALKEIFSYLLSLDHAAILLTHREGLQKLGFREEDCVEEYLCLARPHSKKPHLRWDPRFWVSGLSAC